MDNNQQYYEEEIDLYELVMLLWNKKVLIIACTLVLAIVAGGYTKLFISPIYETRLRLLVNSAETIVTKYGVYNSPIKTSGELVELLSTNDVLQSTIDELGDSDMTVVGLRNSIKIESSKEMPNTFIVKVGADSPEKSLLISNILFANYKEYVDDNIGEMSLNYFKSQLETQIRTYQIELLLQKNLLVKTEAVAESIPETYMSGDILRKAKGNLDYLVLDNVINPNRIAIDQAIIDYRNTINDLETKTDHFSSLISMIDQDLALLSAESVDAPTFMNDDIYLSSAPILPTQKSSPSMLMNTAIGGVLGGMLSCFYVLVAEWVKSKKKEEVSA